MLKSQYDAIITNIAGSGFTGYYKKGVNIKLSNNVTVITVWKPNQCPYYGKEVYKDAIIELSGNGTARCTYFDWKKIGQAIEEAIDILNKENENLIDRQKIGTYEHIMSSQTEKKKTSAIKYADLELGGIYLDEKGKKWFFLGQGTLFENGIQKNKTNDGIHYLEYMYMEYQEDQVKQLNLNQFKINDFIYPDTYASKKRFFEKYGQFSINSQIPISFICESSTYQCYPGIKPKIYHEEIDIGRKM